MATITNGRCVQPFIGDLSNTDYDTQRLYDRGAFDAVNLIVCGQLTAPLHEATV
jgi:hypothetical protein